MAEMEIGIDPAKPGGDMTSICLRIGKETHVIPDPFASELAKILTVKGHIA